MPTRRKAGAEKRLFTICVDLRVTCNPAKLTAPNVFLEIVTRQATNCLGGD